jgi:hydroxypyruvate reductase
MAAEAAIRQAEEEGYQALLLTTYLQGEAREVGRLLASLARGMAADGVPLPRPGLIVAGGETTVTLAGSGLGGRNIELALGAVRDLAGVENVALATLATDGGDGPTDAAGALVTGETLARGVALGLSPEEFLLRNDSYHYFDRLDDLLKPGPTQTNVNDLAFVFTFRS